MKLTFKDVGQGDSIILEWNDNDTAKIGLIDCNRKFGKNPVLEYIESTNYKEIDFLYLSHPHTDHYSGMVELLNYLESKKITIASFGSTIHLLGNDFYKYLNGVEVSTDAKTDLEKLFAKLDVLIKSGIIKKLDYLVEGTAKLLKDGIYLKCLSPSVTEAKIFMDQVDLQPRKNKTKASQSANFLSTIFKVVIGDRYFLLTSDSEIPTFERLMTENIHKNLTQKQLFICQLPHHGSQHNYHPPFWDYITKYEQPQAVVSAGLHETYQHPHLPVLMGFHNQGYTIHSTNIVYGMVKYAHYLKELANLSSKLDTFSDIISSNTGGDKSFTLA